MWSPQPGPQLEAFQAVWCPEIFYGGARGGGKSDYLLGDFLQEVPTYGAAWHGVLFRRTYPELQELIKRSHQIYADTGAEWFEQAKEWRWNNGSCLRFRYLESVLDSSRYQGHQYTWIGWDELTQWPTLEAYDMLKACLRSAVPVPVKRIRASGNPGGPGHQAVKQYFIDPAPKGFELINDLRGERMFIPSRVTDNLILMQNDPGYVESLSRLSTPELVRMWLEGDWNVVAGSYFAQFGQQHIIEPQAIPKHWLRFRALDWGFAEPFACLWGAYSDGVEVGPDGKHTASKFPKGSIIVYREWYGWDGRPNKGVRQPPEAIADGILAREVGEKISYGVADPSIFKHDSGPSIGELMSSKSLVWGKADNARIAGWQQIHQRLSNDALYIFKTCAHLIRTLPALQHDAKNLEDILDGYEDHAPDALRYLCMSRPYNQTPAEPQEMKVLNQYSYSEFMTKALKPRASASGF